MFWTRELRRKQDNLELLIGVIIVEAENQKEAWEKIYIEEKTFGDGFYCVGTIRGPYNTKKEAEPPQ